MSLSLVALHVNLVACMVLDQITWFRHYTLADLAVLCQQCTVVSPVVSPDVLVIKRACLLPMRSSLGSISTAPKFKWSTEPPLKTWVTLARPESGTAVELTATTMHSPADSPCTPPGSTT
jgi:hypothetical protein